MIDSCARCDELVDYELEPTGWACKECHPDGYDEL